MTRSELGRLLGLPKSTVSVVVGELAATEVVREQGTAAAGTARRGRPGTVVALNPRTGAAIGLAYGFATVRVALLDAAHGVVAEDERRVGPLYGPERAMTVAAELVESVISRAALPSQPAPVVGVSAPLLGMQVAALTPDAAAFSGTHMSPGWEGVDVAAQLRSALPYAVTFDNDANCDARGELLFGAGRPFRDFVYLKLHSGVGGALVLDGTVRRGRAGGAGEFGHMTLDSGGPLCRCGNRGCLEAYAGIPAILGALQPWSAEPLTFTGMLELLARRNPAAARAVLDAAHHVGQAVGGLCNAVSPEAVILGGALSRVGNLLLQEVRRSMAQTCLAINADVQVVCGELGSRAGALGAAALALTAAGSR
jgi:predicted NBD/HSP70 family sugar kinase